MFSQIQKKLLPFFGKTMLLKALTEVVVMQYFNDAEIILKMRFKPYFSCWLKTIDGGGGGAASCKH